MQITVCIISYNEEQKIKSCLESVKDFADEIVIIDSNSNDKTVEIAKKYTEKIYFNKFNGYVEQKNFAIAKSTNDWIFNIDCDEVVSSELKKNILNFKNTIPDADAYYLNRKTYYVYKWLNHCWYPDKKIRLFNKQKAKWIGIKLHEKIKVDSNKIGKLYGDLLHYSFDSISDHLQTIDKFTEIAAEEFLQKNKKVTVFTAITHSLWIFIKLYFIKQGFRDGLAGFVVSVLSSVHVFVKYIKIIFKNLTLK